MHEINDASRWDLKPLYNDVRDWDTDYENTLKKGFNDLVVLRGALGQGNNLEHSLDLFFDFNRALERLYTYAHLLSDADLANQDNLVRLNQVRSLYSDFSTQTSWMQSEILRIENLDPQGKYQRYLDQVVRNRPHTLSEPEEKLLSLSHVPQRSSSLFSLLNNVELQFSDAVDSEGKTHKVTLASYQNLIKAKDRKLRQSAFEQLYTAYDRLKLTIGENLYQKVLSNDFQRKVRHFSSSMESALFGNEIPTQVYDNLIATVEKPENLETLHRYIDWKARALGLDSLHAYDVYMDPFDEIERMKFTQEEAINLVLEAIAPLGEEYVSIARKGLMEQRWIDWYDRPGKRSGGYSSGCYDSMPYILLNYTGSIEDLFTLVHELGHSMHSYYSNKHQPYPYASYTIFVAEVASTFHEEMLYNLLMEKTKNPKLRQFYLHYKAERLRATLHRQTMFAHFEKSVHELVENRGVMTVDFITKTFNELYRQYFGKHFTIDPFLGLEALRIPHFYSSFYVYQYSVGISASLALYTHFHQNPIEGRKRYLEFISSGSSKTPVEILQTAGVDVRDPETIQEALNTFKKLVDQLDT